jgi:hypothetical protein
LKFIIWLIFLFLGGFGAFMQTVVQTNITHEYLCSSSLFQFQDSFQQHCHLSYPKPKAIAFFTSYNAIVENNKTHFRASQDLVNRYIQSGVPTEDDYLLKTKTNIPQWLSS